LEINQGYTTMQGQPIIKIKTKYEFNVTNAIVLII